MTATLLRTAATSLSSLAATLGREPDEIQAGETADRLTVSMRDVPSTMLRSLTLEHCRTLLESFGDSITFEVVADSLPLLSLSDATDEDAIERFHKDIEKCASATVTVAIDKGKLANHCGLIDNTHRVVVFLFRPALLRLLTHTLKKPDHLEAELWNGAVDRKVVIVVDEDDLSLEGAYWAILGIDQADRMGQMIPVCDEDVQSAARVLRHCKEAVRWDKQFLAVLAPACFRISGDHQPESDVARLAMANWANVCILFTADRVQVIRDRIVGTFATERSRCQVSLFDELPGGVSPMLENVTALGDIAEWAYDEKWGSDRLRMVQVNVSRSLAYGEQPRPASSLVVRAQGIGDELEWHWKSFIAEEIDRFVEEERTLEDEVAQAVEGFDGQVAEMIKSLSGSMLAAVGVLIGSVIAAAFKGTFNATVFSIGVWAYVVYLLLFPGLYNMIHHILRFRAASSIFERRRKRFRRLLAPEVVDEITGTHVRNAKRRFWGWFIFTLVAFGGVIIACYLADHHIPSLLKP